MTSLEDGRILIRNFSSTLEFLRAVRNKKHRKCVAQLDSQSMLFQKNDETNGLCHGSGGESPAPHRRGPGFNLRLVHMVYVVNKVAPRQVYFFSGPFD